MKTNLAAREPELLKMCGARVQAPLFIAAT
jgi:hypothetical protein